MTTSVFGPIGGPWSVEAAVVATLERWLWPTYLEEVERQTALKVGTVLKPERIYGAFDDGDYIAELMPGVLVKCTEPDGEPERFASIGYTQNYAVSVMCVMRNDHRHIARRDSGLYAEAVMAAIGQQLAGDHPDLISDVWMTASPSTDLPLTSTRLLYMSRVDFAVYLAPIMVDSAGPVAPLLPGGTAPPWPVVEQINITVTVVPIDEDVNEAPVTITVFPGAAPVLDTFANRAAEAPLSDGGRWSGATGPFGIPGLVTDGQYALNSTNSGNQGSSWMTPFQVPFPWFVALAVAPTDVFVVDLYWLADPTAFATTGFYLTWGPKIWTLSDATTFLTFAAGTAPLHDGDSIGFNLDTTGLLTVWHQLAGALWRQVGEAATAYTGAAYGAFDTNDPNVRFSSVGGG